MCTRLFPCFRSCLAEAAIHRRRSTNGHTADVGGWHWLSERHKTYPSRKKRDRERSQCPRLLVRITTATLPRVGVGSIPRSGYIPKPSGRRTMRRQPRRSAHPGSAGSRHGPCRTRSGFAHVSCVVPGCVSRLSPRRGGWALGCHAYGETNVHSHASPTASHLSRFSWPSSVWSTNANRAA